MLNKGCWVLNLVKKFEEWPTSFLSKKEVLFIIWGQGDGLNKPQRTQDSLPSLTIYCGCHHYSSHWSRVKRRSKNLSFSLLETSCPHALDFSSWGLCSIKRFFGEKVTQRLQDFWGHICHPLHASLFPTSNHIPHLNFSVDTQQIFSE